MADGSEENMSDAVSTPYAPFPDEPAYDMSEDQNEYSRGPFLFLVALIVLAAFGGVVYVAYQQGLREGQRTPPPTIAANPGTIREKPTDPGGLEEPYQDKFVLNGEDTATDISILQGPEEPMARPLPAEEAVPEEPVDVEESIRSAAGEPTIADLIDENRAVDAGAALAVIDVAPDPVPVAEPMIIERARPPASEPVVEEPESVPLEVTRAPEEPVELAVVPDPEPAAPVDDLQAAAPEGDRTQVTGSLNPSSGNWVVQVASVKGDQGQAQRRADSIGQSHQSTLASLALEVKRADLGDKGIYYRVRIGPFAEKSGASEICQKLKGEGQDCFVAKP